MTKRKGAGLLVSLLLLTGLLAACGEATATTAPATTAAGATTAAATTVASAAGAATTAASGAGAAATATTATGSTTSAATTAAPTTALASTTAATTSTTAVAGATTAATISAAGTGSTTGAIIPPPGATQVKLDDTATQALLATIPLPGDLTKNAKLLVYASDDDADKLSTSYGTLLTSAGYKPAIPGTTGAFNKQGDSYAGIISNGDNDLIISMTAITGSFATGSGSSTLPADVVKSIDDQVKGKKTGIIVISGKGLIQALFNAAAAGAAASPAAGAGATPAGTPTK